MAALPSHATTPIDHPALYVRDLVPADAPLLDDLHAGLSDTSRYQRYQSPKPRLTDGDRAYLSATDGHDHLALLAIDRFTGSPIASVRAVRSHADPHVAEIAAEVVDAWQRHGIGSDLIARLARRCASVGIQRFTATVLSTTGLTRSLVRRGWRVASFDGPSTDLEVEVWTLLART